MTGPEEVWDAAGLVLADDFAAVAEVLDAMDAEERTAALFSVLALAHEAARRGRRMDLYARRVLVGRRSGGLS